MLSYPGCHVRAVHWLYWNSHIWLSSDVIKTCIQELMETLFKHKMQYLMVSKKKNPLFVRGWDRKICPSASLVMPKSDAQDRFFYPTFTLMIHSYDMETGPQLRSRLGKLWIRPATPVYKVSGLSITQWQLLSNFTHEIIENKVAILD